MKVGLAKCTSVFCWSNIDLLMSTASDRRLGDKLYKHHASPRALSSHNPQSVLSWSIHDC